MRGSAGGRRRFPWAPLVLTAALVLLVQAVTVTPAAAAPGAGAGPVLARPLPGVRWTPAFAEEFRSPSATALLAEGRWHSGWYGDGRLTHPVNSAETALYHRDLLRVGQGVGRFSTRPNREGLVHQGRVERHLGAILNTDPEQAGRGFTMGYGYVEARLQQPAGSPAEVLWPAFWLNGHEWPAAMEIDVVEGDGTDGGCAFNLHHGPPGTDVTNLDRIDRTRTVRGATSGMHVYGADIRPDGITFYYDGRPVYAWSGQVPNAQRYLVIGLTTGGTVDREATLLVDWVRAWHRSGSR